MQRGLPFVVSSVLAGIVLHPAAAAAGGVVEEAIAAEVKEEGTKGEGEGEAEEEEEADAGGLLGVVHGLGLQFFETGMLKIDLGIEKFGDARVFRRLQFIFEHPFMDGHFPKFSWLDAPFPRPKIKGIPI